MIPQWVGWNLNNYNNRLIPNKLIKKHGVEKVTQQIKTQMGVDVEIKTSIIADETLHKVGRKKKDITYIAEVSKKV
ncbi:hypothetical protein [Breznakia pachnodae]|uniref:Uncharacterized protein n=1 Tax=Breznakia pachnodae TaxID=265178 RepID=A0ABU0E404_9FIRM|nr:hypothetical protein [Breznakia pachnodae]MDQ0361633.1 hypothetical protein [Breznakia pachnodae]